MKFKGKIAFWYWLILIGCNGFILYELLFDPDQVLVLVISLLLLNLIFLPNVLRNYVLIEDGKIRLYFGLFKDSMEISDILSIRRTRNPLSSSAASLDRLSIAGRRQEMMVSVRDKELLLAELLKQNPEIQII
ncbi:PH domain-containing protein [Anaerolentibacter hominis]|uniref:PH domain-containing protein n=1 Tax=Anaerolentibacter hominis TaxID=3079009 RepID=UPI0031B89F3F